MTTADIEELVTRQQDEAEWTRRFDERWQDYVRTHIDETEAMRAVFGLGATARTRHNSIYTVKDEELCTCHIGAACSGPCFSAARTDVDGPYTDHADFYLRRSDEWEAADLVNDEDVDEWINRDA